MLKKYIISLLLLTASLSGWAQMENPTKWDFFVSDNNPEMGDEISLIFEATIDPAWYVYSMGFDEDCGPIPTSFEFNENSSYKLAGKVKAVGDKEKYDDVFKCTIRVFKGKIQYIQKVKINNPDFTIPGQIAFQACKDNGLCVYLDASFEMTPATPVKKLAGTEGNGGKTTTPPDNGNDNKADQTKKTPEPKPGIQNYTRSEELIKKEKQRQNLKKQSEGDKKQLQNFIEKYGE